MKYTNPKVPSSYRENNLGKFFYNYVLEYKPKLIIEFGTLHGYSAIAMAMALHELGEGKIITYDLYDAYPHHKGNKRLVEEVVKSYKLDEIIRVEVGDFHTWVPEDADLYHVDISNDGQILKKIEAKLKGKHVIFEGGSKERDGAQWMNKFNKMPMLSSGIRYDVVEPRYPSISKLL